MTVAATQALKTNRNSLDFSEDECDKDDKDSGSKIEDKFKMSCKSKVNLQLTKQKDCTDNMQSEVKSKHKEVKFHLEANSSNNNAQTCQSRDKQFCYNPHTNIKRPTCHSPWCRRPGAGPTSQEVRGQIQQV